MNKELIRKTVIATSIFLFLHFSYFVIFYTAYHPFETASISLKEKNYNLELGDSLSNNPDLYIRYDVNYDSASEKDMETMHERTTFDFSQVDTKKEGVYRAVISQKRKFLFFDKTDKLEMLVTVKDTTPPTARLLNETPKIESGTRVNVLDFITDIHDMQAVEITFGDGSTEKTYSMDMPSKDSVLTQKESEDEITKIVVFEEIRLVDASGNKNTIPFSIIVFIPDETPPVISGTEDKILYLDEINKAVSAGNQKKKGNDLSIFKYGVDWMEGVKAEDDRDGDLTEQVKINFNDMDFGIAGSGKVVYSVRDEAGNRTEEEITVEIREGSRPQTIISTSLSDNASNFPEFVIEGNVSKELSDYAFSLYMTVPENVRNVIRSSGGKVMVSDNPAYTGGSAGRMNQKNSPNFPGIVGIYAITEGKVKIAVQHECGHYLDNYLGIETGQPYSMPYWGQWISMSEEFQQIFEEEIGAAGYASYNSTDPVEFFAETFRRMITEPQKAASRTPKAVKFINDCLSQI